MAQLYEQADASLFAGQPVDQQKDIKQGAHKESNMTTVTAIRELEATEVTATTCACGANAVVFDEDRESCVTCAIYQWMEPAPEPESIVQAVEERLCVECGGSYLPLYDEQTHCGLCVEAMAAVEYGASAMGTAGIEKAQLVQTLGCGLCGVVFIPTTAVQRRGGLCASCAALLYGEAPYRGYDAQATSYEALIQDVGDDPDYLYDVDDLHGVPVDRAEDTDLSRAVTRLLGAEDLAASLSVPYHRDQCVLCEDVEYGTPGCPGVSG